MAMNKMVIEKLGAVRISDGRWVYRDDGMRLYYVVTDKDLLNLHGRIEAGQQDAYSLWCAQTDAEELPSATQIASLRSEADRAGDQKMVAICDRFLNNEDVEALVECGRVIADAEAQA